ncbi:IclR family transcriptional regulator [Ramlibacter sp.]|uniref:IclR family transcriptional regulator n=1 Tax=Ramlibacter sp. TaxID=1917967 RepID=UPI003D0F1A0C
MKEDGKRTGTQTIERVALLLRELAVRGSTGWAGRNLAQHCGLQPSTAHRILQGLVREGFVQQRASDARYFIGPFNFELGLTVPGRLELLEAAPAVLRRLARALPNVTTVLFLRSGNECVCTGRGGAYARAATLTRVGQRVPALALASGIAIVAHLPEAEARAAWDYARKKGAHLGDAHFAQLREMLKSARRDGYVVSEGVLWQTVNSIAVPFGPSNSPIGAVAISSRSADTSPAALLGALPELRFAAEKLAAHAAWE